MKPKELADKYDWEYESGNSPSTRYFTIPINNLSVTYGRLKLLYDDGYVVSGIVKYQDDVRVFLAQIGEMK